MRPGRFGVAVAVGCVRKPAGKGEHHLGAGRLLGLPHRLEHRLRERLFEERQPPDPENQYVLVGKAKLLPQRRTRLGPIRRRTEGLAVDAQRDDRQGGLRRRSATRPFGQVLAQVGEHPRQSVLHAGRGADDRIPRMGRSHQARGDHLANRWRRQGVSQAQEAVGPVAAAPPAQPRQFADVGLAPQKRARRRGRAGPQQRSPAQPGRVALAAQISQFGFGRLPGRQDVHLFEIPVPRQRLEELEVGHILAERIGAQADLSGRVIDGKPRPHECSLHHRAPNATSSAGARVAAWLGLARAAR